MKNYSLTNGMLAGLIASIISALFLLIVGALALMPQDFDFITIQGNLFGLATDIVTAWIVYFAIGIILWGILYAIVEPNLKGSPLAKGLTFGVFIFLIVMLIIMPVSNAGFFATKYGISAIVITFLLDVIFGITLSESYGKLNNREIIKA